LRVHVPTKPVASSAVPQAQREMRTGVAALLASLRVGVETEALLVAELVPQQEQTATEALPVSRPVLAIAEPSAVLPETKRALTLDPNPCHAVANACTRKRRLQ